MTTYFLTKRRMYSLVLVASIWLGLTGCGSPPAGNTATSGASTPAALTSPVPATIDCNTAQPADIVTAVYNAIEQSKVYTREEWQFNVSVATSGSRKTIKVTGWSAHRDDIFNVVTTTAVNCTAQGTDFVFAKDQLGPNYRSTVSCATGYFACGDVCIPNGEICKLTGASTSITPPANANSVVRSNSNANSTNSAPSNSKPR